jgi:hypothetical protein
MGDRLWEIGRSPSQHAALLVFGLIGILTAFLAASIAVGGGGLVLAANVLLSIGAFFLVLALFLGAYTTSGDSATSAAWKIAQIFAAVLVLWISFVIFL